MCLLTSMNGMETEYILVTWPDAQRLMDYPWFDTECYLMQGMGDQEHFDSSYFVPKIRLQELNIETDGNL